MEFVPALDRCTCSEEAAYLAVGKVESLFQKLKVKRRLVSPEPSSPYPWISCYSLFWGYYDAAGAVIRELEVEAVISIPLRNLTSGPSRMGNHR